jgi:hypothetical protein
MRILTAALLALSLALGCHMPDPDNEVTPRNGELLAFVPVKVFVELLTVCAPFNPDLSLTVTYEEVLPPGNSEQFFRMSLAALTSENQTDCLKKGLFAAGGEIIDDTGDVESGSTT